MADVPVPSIATVTPALADTLLGVQSGAVKRMSVGALPLTTAAQAQITALGYSALRDGAVGDGITDDTLALRAAITAAGVGGTLVFPAGKTFLVSGSLVPLEAQTWIGYGAKIKRCNAITTTTTGAISTGTGSTTIAVASSAAFAVGMHVIGYQSGAVFDINRHIITAIPDSTSITVGTAFTTGLASGSTISTGGEIITTAASDFCVYGLEIDDNRANNTGIAKWQIHVAISATGDRTKIADCYLHDCVSEGIELGGAASEARGNTILTCGGNGIHFSGTNGGRAIGNYIKDVTLLGSATDHADGCIIFSNTTGDSIIANNYCENGLSGIGSIDSDDNSGVVISGNTIRNCTATAIEGIFPASTTGGKVTITGNLIFDSVKVEMNFTPAFAVGSGPYDWVFSGNYLENTRLALAKGFGLLVANNIITSAADTTNGGISVNDCRRVSISGNQITGFAYGCYVSGTNSAAVKVSGNTLVNQYTMGVGIDSTATGPAISVEGCTVVVESGYVTAAGYIGISASNNLAVLNNVMNIQTTSTSACILCPNGAASVNGAVVTGNVIRSAGMTYAIRAAGGSQNNWIVNNYTQQTVSNGGGASNTVAGNYTIF